jgi:hypothetical protein
MNQLVKAAEHHVVGVMQPSVGILRTTISKYQGGLCCAVTCAVGKCGGAASYIRYTPSRVTSPSGNVGVGMDEERRDVERACCHAGRLDSTRAGSDERTRCSSPAGYITSVPLNFAGN